MLSTEGLPSCLGPAGDEAVTPAGLGKEKVPQGHLSPHFDVPEGIAEQTCSGKTLIYRCSFQAEISPFHTRWGPAWFPSTANLTYPQSLHTSHPALVCTCQPLFPPCISCGCRCPSQIPPAHGTQLPIFGPTKTSSSVLDTTEKPRSLSAVRVIGWGAVEDAGWKLVSAFHCLLGHVLNLSYPFPVFPLIHSHCSRWGYTLFTLK